MSDIVNLVVESLNGHLTEASSTEEAYKKHSDSAKKLLGSIHDGLKAHASKDSQKNWGHVGDVEHVHKKLQDLHDMLHGTGEYAKK